jgi:hypothetical protein
LWNSGANGNPGRTNCYTYGDTGRKRDSDGDTLRFELGGRS